MWHRNITLTALLGWGLFSSLGGQVFAEPGFIPHPGQVAPMKQDSMKMSFPSDVRQIPSSAVSEPESVGAMAQPDTLQATFSTSGNGYDPSGRRDPFTPILQHLGSGQVDLTLPPLQRVGLTDMNLIAVIWGAYGHTAMVQTPDGNGYAIRKGTRIGPNNGVVSAITDKGIVVQERFTDVYGRKQEREYVKLLHPKEATE